MKPTNSRLFTTLFAATIVTFVVINGCSWMPGYGGRVDREPGMEVERYFGWPACFRAEIWRSDHPHEVAVGAYIPPIPLSDEMTFVRGTLGVVPLLLDFAFTVAIGSIAALFFVAGSRGRAASWMWFAGVAFASVAFAVLLFGGATSVYL